MSEGQAVDFELNINLEDEKIRAWGGAGGPPLEPGVYDFEILSAEQSAGKTSGNPTLKVVFGCINEGLEHVELPKWYSLQPKALGRIKNLMMAVGARLDAIRSSEMIGRQIVAEVSHRQADPQPQPDGSVKEGGIFCEIFNERAPEGVEQATAGQTQPAPTQTTQAAPTNGNGNAKAQTAPTPPPQQSAPRAAVRRAIGQAKA